MVYINTGIDLAAFKDHADKFLFRSLFQTDLLNSENNTAASENAITIGMVS